ncbi:acyltransferase family protein [Desulfovibrio sp. UCD-KL4C]|uniref:acyltransferase family protein n=1 Tax=Desulfovibrio sp. UCD-KL4C TaxID=2578120 RepID=UPI0025BE5E45|nr:acyltransferase family protein [Desulfovibrio sp. UCD-KL4C]
MRQYRTEIDGLRALAVLGVLLFHLKLNTGGWLGVDVFFVISGYLISSILFKEFDSTGTISVSHFYLRRVRRIMPALLVCITVSFIPIAILLSNTPAFTEYSQSIISALLSASNIFFWKHAGYFAVKAEVTPLLHTWTLGIEEQFYIIVPAIFVTLSYLTKKKRNAVWGIVFIATVLSFITCRYGKGIFSTDFIFYMLPTRMWELFLGLFVALLLKKFPHLNTKNIYTELLSCGSVIFLCFAFITYIGNTHFAEKALFTALATCFFIITTTRKSVAGKLMSLRSIRFVGNISYSIYLWHWPIIVIVYLVTIRFDIGNVIFTKLCDIVLTLFISYLSWKYVENPFRKKETWSICLKQLSPFIVVTMIFAIVGMTTLSAAKGKYELNLNDDKMFISFDDFKKGNYCSFGKTDAAPQFFVVGDSHARAISSVLTELAQNYGISGKGAAVSSTAPLFNIHDYPTHYVPYEQEWVKYVKNNRIKNILLVARWGDLFDASKWKYHNQIVSQGNAFNVAKKEALFLLKLLTGLGARVWIMDDIPNFENPPLVLTRLFNKPYKEDYSTKKHEHFMRKALKDENIPNVFFLSPVRYLTENGKIISVKDGRFLYEDKHHLSIDGAHAIKDMFIPFFESMKYEAI